MKTCFRKSMAVVTGAALAVAASVLAPSAILSLARADPNSAALMDIQNLVDNLGTTVYASTYGGFTAPNNGAEIDVYLTNLNPVVEAAFTALSPLTTIVFKSTPNTIATLNSMTDTLAREWSSVQADGINLDEFGPDPEQGVLDIGVIGLTSSDTRYFDQRFGATNVNVYNVDQAVADAITTQVTRTDDTAPYNAGDAIMNGTHDYGCSSGFGLNVSGAKRILTAGHCWGVGTNIVNAKVTSTGWTGSNNVMGQVRENPYLTDTSSSLDAALFTGCNTSDVCGGDDLAFTGVSGTTAISIVSGKGSWAAGDQVCSSGAYGGERCDMTVKEVNYCELVGQGDGTSRIECHLTKVTGSKVTVDGDSGGPMFRFSGSSLLAVGIVTAGNQTNTSYFTGINAILGQFGASLITG